MTLDALVTPCIKLNEDDILLSGPVTDCHDPNKSLKIVLGNGDALFQTQVPPS